MPAYALADHVHACRVENSYILLDLLHDKYIGLERNKFDEIVRDSQRDGISSSPHKDVTGADELADELISLGLLTRSNSSRLQLQIKPIRHAETELPSITNSISLADMVRLPAFLLAARRASWKLTHEDLFTSITEIKTRKTNRAPSSEHYSMPNSETQRLLALTKSFNMLRPMFPRNYLCLFDSFALVEFLARYDLFPDWVFGVREDPFSAHCWVQNDGSVLNDRLDRITLFTPIMIV